MEDEGPDEKAAIAGVLLAGWQIEHFSYAAEGDQRAHCYHLVSPSGNRFAPFGSRYAAALAAARRMRMGENV